MFSKNLSVLPTDVTRWILLYWCDQFRNRSAVVLKGLDTLVFNFNPLVPGVY